MGFGHCLGMCGPIVASLALSSEGRSGSVLLPHLLYNFGRMTTYGVLGGIMGMTGSFARVTVSIASLQKGVMIFAAALIVAMGLAMADRIPLSKIFGDYHHPGGTLARGFRRLSAERSTAAYYPLGLLLGLLPCGPVYTALVAAARAGMEAGTSLEGFFLGMGLMFSFGLGTVPSLLLVAKLADLGWVKRRQVIYRASSILMIILGVYFVIRAIRY